jgi:Family of unknown function (DUF6527)
MGESISLEPAIGSWSFECQSHYWIRHNQVQWAPRWSREQIEIARNRDCRLKEQRPRGESPVTELAPRRYPGARLFQLLQMFIRRLRD